MSDRYELIGQTECARRFEAMDRKVASTKLFGLCLVSTIFLSLDHSWRGDPPLLFETMAFWRGEGGYEQTRCATWSEAEQQHATMCAECARPGAVVAYIGRRLKDWWFQAKWDAGRRWRDLRGIEPDQWEKMTDEIEGFVSDEENW